MAACKSSGNSNGATNPAEGARGTPSSLVRIIRVVSPAADDVVFQRPPPVPIHATAPTPTIPIVITDADEDAQYFRHVRLLARVIHRASSSIATSSIA